jgi:hypothetical protein
LALRGGEASNVALLATAIMAENSDCSDQPCSLPQHSFPVIPIGAVPLEDPIPFAVPGIAHGDQDLQTPFVLLPSMSAVPGESSGDFHHDNSPLPGGILPRTEWSTLSLPDLDDTSMKSVVRYMENYQIDLRWSIISNSFFIIGGVCYVILTAWDCFVKWKRDDGSNQSKSWLYISLDVFAPTVYLINSIVDICWAEYLRLQQRKKRSLTKTWESFRLHGISSPSTNKDDDDSNQRSCRCWSRMRKHAAHRRTLAAAFTFGIAAYLGVIAAVLRNWYMPSIADEADHDRWVYNMECIDQWTDHLNVGSAIISMTGKRHRPWFAQSDPNRTSWLHDSDRLIDLGDLLFLIGSLMDALLTDFHLDNLALFSVLSSLFWMIDGFLYMRSDMLKATKLEDAEFLFFDRSDRNGGENSQPISVVV